MDYHEFSIYYGILFYNFPNMEAMRTLDFYIDMISGNDYKEIIKKEADSGNKILNYILKTLS